MKFRKKPVVIDAFQWEGGKEWVPVAYPPKGMVGVREWLKAGTLCTICRQKLGLHGSMITLESPDGEQRVCPGDWIITGVKGETYPCKPDIFEQTYDPV